MYNLFRTSFVQRIDKMRANLRKSTHVANLWRQRQTIFKLFLKDLTVETAKVDILVLQRVFETQQFYPVNTYQ